MSAITSNLTNVYVPNITSLLTSVTDSNSARRSSESPNPIQVDLSKDGIKAAISITSLTQNRFNVAAAIESQSPFLAQLGIQSSSIRFPFPLEPNHTKTPMEDLVLATSAPVLQANLNGTLESDKLEFHIGDSHTSLDPNDPKYTNLFDAAEDKRRLFLLLLKQAGIQGIEELKS